MIDVKAARISGAIKVKKARVLWKDGIIRLYDRDGLVSSCRSEEPRLAKRGIHPVWTAETEHGEITIKALCMTCGGWLKVIRQPAEQLWGTP